VCVADTGSAPRAPSFTIPRSSIANDPEGSSEVDAMKPSLPGAFWRGMVWVFVTWAVAIAITAAIVSGLAGGLLR
jgi:hypothetical protein